MQEELIMFVVLILGNLHSCCGIPSAHHNYDKNHDNQSNQNVAVAISPKKYVDSVTQATMRRSIPISALHIPYEPKIYASTIRRHETGQLTEDERAVAASEGFYPSFMRSSRQYFQASEGERFRPSTIGRAKFAEQSLLGSGDFGIIKGGTFYQENDPPVKPIYNDFYGVSLKSHNGHQRPYAAPLVQKIRYPTDSADPFSNFRDFADINVSNDAGQYSEHYMIYSKRNDSEILQKKGRSKNDTTKKIIRNIKDQLDLIDAGVDLEQKTLKISKAKLKSFNLNKNVTKTTSTKIPLPIITSTISSSDSEKDFMIALS